MTLGELVEVPRQSKVTGRSGKRISRGSRGKLGFVVALTPSRIEHLAACRSG